MISSGGTDATVVFRAHLQSNLSLPRYQMQKGLEGREMCLKNEKNDMSLCDMEIFKTAVVQKWGPIKLGQWLICQKEPLINYIQMSNNLFE